MRTEWEKHFYEQVINKGYYDPVDETILEELFNMLCIEVYETDEDGEYVEDIPLMNAYILVLREYLAPKHQDIFFKLLDDMNEEKYGQRLLQEESQPQTQEG